MGASPQRSLLARDRNGPAPAKQILIYAMLDDRNTRPDPRLAPFASWTYDDNITGWRGLLGASYGTDDVPHTAAPARATDVNDLPPAYVEVGQLDIFCNEDIAYALKLPRPAFRLSSTCTLARSMASSSSRQSRMWRSGRPKIGGGCSSHSDAPSKDTALS